MQRFHLLRRRSSVLNRVALLQRAQGNVPCQSIMRCTRTFSSLPDHDVVGLPALSPTMETGTIAKWRKQEGELIAAGDIICDIETDKAVVEFEAQDDYYMAKILKPEGSSDVGVGEPIFVSVMEEDQVAAFQNFSLDEANAAPSSPATTEVTSESSPAAAKDEAKAETKGASLTPERSVSQQAKSGDQRVFASPLAKKIARESGVMLSVINGTGPRGRIVKADVEDALARGDATASSTSAATEEASTPSSSPSPSSSSTQPISTVDYVDYPISPEAQALAQQLAQQKLDIPHYHLSADVTLDQLLSARDRLNAGRSEETKLSVNDFVVRAASLAMKRVPEVNSAWLGSVIRQYRDCHINMVVSTAAGGSVSPVLSHVNTKGLEEINKDVRTMMNKAEETALEESDLASGTFTISNVGMYDVRSLAGIVHPSQSCHLGLGTIQKKVVPNDDPDAEQIYKYAMVMSATLACDHRVIDGAVGAQWLAVFKELVEDPLKMIL